MAADTGAGIGAEKYISLTTFRRSGDAVATPTWVVPVDGGRVGLWTGSASGKVKRLRNNPSVTMQASDSRGRVTAGAPVVAGTAEIVTSGPSFEAVQAAVRAKYGVMVPISRFFGKVAQLRKGRQPYGDVVLVITPS